jgi:hypothetical protein
MHFYKTIVKMKSDVIFVKYHPHLQTADAVLVVVVVLVLVPRPL